MVLVGSPMSQPMRINSAHLTVADVIVLDLAAACNQKNHEKEEAMSKALPD